MPNHALDGTEANRAIFNAEAEDFAQRLARQLIDTAARSLCSQGVIYERTDAHHAHATLIVLHKDMIIPVHTHDDDAVIPQLVHIEVVAPDAAAQCGDQSADFRGRQHFVEARLLDVEDFSLERQDGLGAPVAALLGRAAGGIAFHQEHFRERGILFLAIGELAR